MASNAAFVKCSSNNYIESCKTSVIYSLVCENITMQNNHGTYAKVE
jgi:hypothetical protein